MSAKSGSEWKVKMDNEFAVVVTESQVTGVKSLLLSLGVSSVGVVELGGLANLQGVIVPAHTVYLAQSLAGQLARLKWISAHQCQMDAHSGGRQSPAGIDGATLALFPKVKR